MEHTSDDETGPTRPSAAKPVPSAHNLINNNNNGSDINDSTSQNDIPSPIADSHPEIQEHDSLSHTNGNATATPPDDSAKQGRKERPISGVVPPYWRHQRSFSRASMASVDTSRSSKLAITLEDHTEDPDASTTKGLWARSVTIDDHVVVSGKTGIGAYVVWMCNVQTLEVRTTAISADQLSSRGSGELTAFF